ncbi:MAG: NADH-quinone oxidoreductase subunit C, partial [Deltaproteobacteria bacterium]|nr:NADH-quinone oxidoreductase subunit C [Deltaproteobacteria bacterium]
MSRSVLDVLAARFGAAVIETHDFRGDETAVVEPGRIREICAFLKEDERCRFDMPIDVTAVDWL